MRGRLECLGRRLRACRPQLGPLRLSRAFRRGFTTGYRRRQILGDGVVFDFGGVLVEGVAGRLTSSPPLRESWLS